jgi:hypothetical protein
VPDNTKLRSDPGLSIFHLFQPIPYSRGVAGAPAKPNARRTMAGLFELLHV